MKHPSYLLALDGTTESMTAAYFAWDLAKKTGARVVAQHVVNARDIWHFLRPKSAGFIGSGPYVAAFEQIANGLREIAEALMLSYRAQVETQGIDFATYIDEGDLVAEICKRAKDHDLLIIGHRMLAPSTSKRDNDYSLCEELADICPCPMLMVSGRHKNWTTMRVRVANADTNISSVDSLNNFVKSLGLNLKIELPSTMPKKEAKQFMNKLAMVDRTNWNIYKNDGEKKPISETELLVIMPGHSGREGLETRASSSPV